MSNLTQPLKIGDVILPHRVLLAPMSGITDLPFRKLAYGAGASLVTSEMVASKELCSSKIESEMRSNSTNLPYSSVQLIGREPYYMSEAAKKLEAQGASIIDINMGCPAKKIISGSCGAALMQDLPLAFNVIEAVVASVNIPVTLKTRLAWEGESNVAAISLAKYAEQLGIKMLTIHARTRQQFYNGKADWGRVKEIKDKVGIPLIVNGDIIDTHSALEAMRKSGADGVMVGRACYGAPWTIGDIVADLLENKRKQPNNLAKYIMHHYNLMLSHYSVDLGVRKARKHLVAYLRKNKCCYNAEERNTMLTATCPKIVKSLIKKIFN